MRLLQPCTQSVHDRISSIKFKKRTKKELLAHISFFKEKYNSIGISKNHENEINWIMGQLRNQAIGNIDLKELKEEVASRQ